MKPDAQRNYVAATLSMHWLIGHAASTAAHCQVWLSSMAMLPAAQAGSLHDPESTTTCFESTLLHHYWQQWPSGSLHHTPVCTRLVCRRLTRSTPLQVRVNWAFQKDQREDTSNHYHIFVGDLGSEVTDSILFEAFQEFPSCSDARVMWDHVTSR